MRLDRLLATGIFALSMAGCTAESNLSQSAVTPRPVLVPRTLTTEVSPTTIVVLPPTITTEATQELHKRTQIPTSIETSKPEPTKTLEPTKRRIPTAIARMLNKEGKPLYPNLNVYATNELSTVADNAFTTVPDGTFIELFGESGDAICVSFKDANSGKQ